MNKLIYGLPLMVSLCVTASVDAAVNSRDAANDAINFGGQEVMRLAYYNSGRQYAQKPQRSSYYYRHKYRENDVFRSAARYQQSSNRRYSAKKRAKRRPVTPVTKPAQRIESYGRPTFVFNPSQLNWGAYDAQGNLLNYGKASGGKGFCPDIGRGCKTPVGHFSVTRKGTASCKSSKYPLGRGGAPMGYCMFFRGGYAIHASNDVPNYNASHGCIRVQPPAAKWLSKQFMNIGTKVVVRGY